MQRLVLLGLNHTTAPLELREKVAFNADQSRRAIQSLRQQFADSEFALISTCNRVELYSARPVHGRPRADEMLQFLADSHSIPATDLRGHIYEKSERDVVEHLFCVASSLDSMVLGETQILGQVRQAYDLAREMSAAGAMLNPLFQRAIAVGRQVMTQTPLGEGRLSLASVAVDYARRIFDQFNNKTILCIGAGKITQLVLQNFAALGVGRLLVSNRDPAKAHDLANRFGGTAAPFEALADHITAADIVVSSTGSSRPIVSRAQFEEILKRRRFRPIFLVDLAVPRDIDPAAGALDNIYLYNLDDLQEVVSKTQAQRTGALAAARKLVADQVEEFIKWHRARELGPAIDNLYKRYHVIAQEELARTLNKLPEVSGEERAHLEELARRIVNKLLHDPIKTLREADGLHGPAAQYLHAMEKLFGLAGDDEESS